mmetsp:Transcript_4601/g.12233  ORF Transcript_4601/g.12233 Transcript_4601/m.12233 type:complete len:236 (-) Transcript_4601:357-1064(-)
MQAALRPHGPSWASGLAVARAACDAEALRVHQRKGAFLLGQHAVLGAKGGAVSLRQTEESAVRFAVEEAQLSLDALGNACIHLLGLEQRAHARVDEGQVPSPFVEEGVDSLVVRMHGREDLLKGRVHGGPDEVVAFDTGLAGLRDKDASGVELALAHIVELDGVQLVARATFERVVEVHDDHVEAGRRVLKDSLCVVNDELKPRVLEGVSVLRKIVPAEIDHIRIDVHHHAALDR